MAKPLSNSQLGRTVRPVPLQTFYGVIRSAAIKNSAGAPETFNSPAGSGAGAVKNTAVTQALTGAPSGSLNVG